VVCVQVGLVEELGINAHPGARAVDVPVEVAVAVTVT
jgi:hypothetical protein